MSEQKKPNGAGLARIKRAAVCSQAGLKSAWLNEAAFRQELMLCGVLLPFALLFGRGGIEQALLIGSLLLVLIVELLNTAVEVVVDRISTEQHELSGLAKDLGSAAVFLSLVHAGVIWVLILLP